MEEDIEDIPTPGYPPDRYYERRRYDRRSRADRRGPLRWDPKAKEKERREGGDRRRPNENNYMRQ